MYIFSQTKFHWDQFQSFSSHIPAIHLFVCARKRKNNSKFILDFKVLSFHYLFKLNAKDSVLPAWYFAHW